MLSKYFAPNSFKVWVLPHWRTPVRSRGFRRLLFFQVTKSFKNSRSMPLIYKSHRTFATEITFFIGLFVKFLLFLHELQSDMMFRGFHDPFKSRHFESNEACRRNTATGTSPWIIYKKTGERHFFVILKSWRSSYANTLGSLF